MHFKSHENGSGSYYFVSFCLKKEKKRKEEKTERKIVNIHWKLFFVFIWKCAVDYFYFSMYRYFSSLHIAKILHMRKIENIKMYFLASFCCVLIHFSLLISFILRYPEMDAFFLSFCWWMKRNKCKKCKEHNTHMLLSYKYVFLTRLGPGSNTIYLFIRIVTHNTQYELMLFSYVRLVLLYWGKIRIFI